MSLLNRGKYNVGTTSNFSYGNQSPAVDVVPLTWVANDRRKNMGPDPTLLGWLCTVGGTPGTWVEIRGAESPMVLMQVPLLRTGAWSTPGQDIWAAPATADWSIIGELGVAMLNGFKTPTVSPTINRLRLDVDFQINQFAVPTAGGLTFSICNQAGTVLASGTANAGSGAPNVQTVIDTPIVGFTATALAVKLNTALAAGVGTLYLGAIMYGLWISP